MVIFKYRGMNEARDKIKVNWFRNGKAFFTKGRAIAPDGTDGRAFRSLSPACRTAPTGPTCWSTARSRSRRPSSRPARALARRTV